MVRAYPNVDEIIRDDLKEMQQEQIILAQSECDGAIFTANEAIGFFRNSSIKANANSSGPDHL